HQAHLSQVGGHVEGGFSALAHLVLGDSGGELNEPETVGGDVDDGEIGDDSVDDALAGEGQRAGRHQLRGAVARGVLHEDDEAFGAVVDVHGPIHTLEHIAMNNKVNAVALL